MSARRRGFLRSNSLSLAFLAIFLAALAGQAIAGQRLYNEEQRAQGSRPHQDAMVGPFAREDSPRWARLGGLRTAVYSNSLVLVFGTIFLASWTAQSIAGWRDHNEELTSHDQPLLSWWQYVRGADFWDRSVQNWQSEFLAVGTMAIFAVYLRQRGSPESKPVGSPHDDTTSND